MTRPSHDRTSVYTNPEGDALTFAQIAMAAAKDPDVTVEAAGDGYLVNGDKYTPSDGPGRP